MPNSKKKPRSKNSNSYNTQEIFYIPAYTTDSNTSHSKSNSSKNSNRSNSSQKNSTPSKKMQSKRTNPVAKFFGTIFKILLTIYIIYSILAILCISRVNTVQLDRAYSNSNATLNSAMVKNVLLIGTDGRTAEDHGRSDSMVLLSINYKSSTITMTSFMRDMYVSIPEYYDDKLNASYSHGGASLLLDTIENNFNIGIDDCIIVDFSSFIKIVDAIGGVNITVSDSEATEINNILISEVNSITGDERNSDLLTSGGEYLLNGKQALSYSRIRYVGNADFERTQRQRTVIDAIIKRVKTPNLFRVFNFANTTASQITTNINALEMYGLSLQVPCLLTFDLVQQRIPADDTWYYDDVDGQSVIVVDFEQNTKYLSDTIYN